MKVIVIDEKQYPKYDDREVAGFKALIEAREECDFAVWGYAGFVMTTDDVPNNYQDLDFDQTVLLMKARAMDRYNEYFDTSNLNDLKRRK